MRKVNIAEAKAHLSELIQAALDGEQVVIARRDTPLVRLAPVPRTPKRTALGRQKGRVWIAPDFDAPVDDMAPYSA